MPKNIVLDLFIFNNEGQLLVNDSADNASFNSAQLRPIILYAQEQKHPVEQIKEYLEEKDLQLKRLEFLPSLLLNHFDTEPETDYLVLSFKIDVEYKDFVWKADEMNMNVTWMKLEEFAENPNLLPEFKDKKFLDSIKGKQIFYTGVYRESDGSNEVIEKTLH